jgi:hypothetical protein
MMTTSRALAVAAVLAALLSGCGLVRTINRVTHTVETNRAMIKGFTQSLKSGEATPFEATYITTGGSPITVTYAVRPPTDLAFKQSSKGGVTGNLELISNSRGEFSCVSGNSSHWACQKLGKAQAIAQNQIVDIYTPTHWINFLEVFSAAAGFAGDKITDSSMTVNGFSMRCVIFTAKGVRGRSTICSTAQNILGYVKVAGDATSFELKSYSSSPSASLFQLPAGAKLTRGN